MRLAVLAAALLGSTPAFAVDAITYKGTLGGLDILVELAAPKAGALVGRYSYMAKGGDIPLDVMDGAKGAIRLAEEAPCTETTCVQDDSGNVIDKPVGAVWSLTPSADGQALTGTWAPQGKGKTLPISLERIAERTLPEGTEITPYGIYDSAFQLTYSGDAVFAPHTAPYEFAKMEVAMDAGPTEVLEGSSFRYAIDPRTKFPFPRVLELADGSLTNPINEALEKRHTLISFYAFDCMAQIYAGFGGNQYRAGTAAGTLGDYDNESVVLTYLSPTVLNWVESGSTYCSGAHPNNHSDTRILDVKTGEAFPLAKVFKDWVATTKIGDYEAEVDQDAAIAAPEQYFWTAGQPLIDFAAERRAIPEDTDFDAECGIDELIASNLALRFAPGDVVVFSLEGLPHVNFACSEDLLSVKLSDIPQLLAPTAGEYFPALAE